MKVSDFDFEKHVGTIYDEGDIIAFVYNGGVKYGLERLVQVQEDLGDDIVGYEHNYAKGNWRRFKKSKMTNVRAAVTQVGRVATPSLADVLGVEPHEVEIFKIVLQKMLEKIEETT